MESRMPRLVELLAPARNADIAIEAIKHGADAVYMGASSHGARVSAGNSVDEIAAVADYAHLFGARVYVTVNTLVYNSEIIAVERLVNQLYKVGADALIVQDMALLKMDLPPIALHASTQCDIRTPYKAKMLQNAGFSQLVLARELSLEETARIHAAVDVPLEAFVHGALCVSYSGDCQAGWVLQHRSANRGECPQICRLPYDLVDGNNKVLMRGKHLLSLRDLNRSAYLERMLESGVSSFKIEGRLKDAGYVKNVVAHYRLLLDRIIAANPGKYRRFSFGESRFGFAPDPQLSFNRGFTSYFTSPSDIDVHMASIDSPKWCGVPVGKVTGQRCGAVVAEVTGQLSNGDGLGYFNKNNVFCGFRLNRVDGDMLYPASSVAIPSGAVLYRNSDKVRSGIMAGNTAVRTLRVDFKLGVSCWGISLSASDESGASAVLTLPMELQPAATPQKDVREKVLGKLGGTHYRIGEIEDSAGNAFIPVSVLSGLRRSLLDKLDKVRVATHKYEYRKSADESALAAMLKGKNITRHDNVANELAQEFYESHGAAVKELAIEASGVPAADMVQVMETRYCLRRETGHCLRSARGREWREPLTLQSPYGNLTLKFDCSRCHMYVYHCSEKNHRGNDGNIK